MSIGTPKRIVCLTEESVEVLYALGCADKIVGVSHYVKRPVEAQKLPKIGMFTSANLDKILDLKPDFILGFSDIQKDIARDLIGLGLDVWISNQRTSSEILDYILRLSRLVGHPDEGLKLRDLILGKIETAQKEALKLAKAPRVYIEEWDDPMITGISWFSEIVEFCGGVNIFHEESMSSLAKDRIVKLDDIILKNPEFVLASWCGKKFNKSSFLERENIDQIEAVKNDKIFELKSEIFLQPGPAPFLEGLEIITNIFKG